MTRKLLALFALAVLLGADAATAQVTSIPAASGVGGSGVTGVTLAGTANEITATGTCTITTTGTCTFSIPSGLVLPGTINGLTITTSTGTITLTNAKVLTVDNSLEFAGTDSVKLTFPTSNAIIARTDAGQTFTGVQTFLSAPVMSGASISATTIPHSAIDATAVTPGAYTAANITVAADGSITSAASGGGGTTRTWAFLFQGTVQAAATGYAFNLPAATSPTMTNGGGTVPIGVLEWPTAQSTYYAWVSFLIPAGYTANGAISYSLEYRSADSTHAAILTPSIACSGTGAVLDNPTFGAGAAVNMTANATSFQTLTAGTWTPNSGSIPACAAGNRIWIKLVIDTNTNLLTAAFDLASLTVSIQAGI